MTETDTLTEISPELIAALQRATSRPVDAMHTGGGVMVTRIDLGESREIWLTREERWIVGFYNLALDECDEGICLDLIGSDDRQNDPEWVAAQIAGIVNRLLGIAS